MAYATRFDVMITPVVKDRLEVGSCLDPDLQTIFSSNRSTWNSVTQIFKEPHVGPALLGG